jgi:hypothetical protein
VVKNASVLDSRAFFERVDLPLRDILRFILPGLLVAAYIDWATYLLTRKHPLSTATALGVALVAGLATFAVNFHEILWPWRRRWKDQLKQIREELNAITRWPQLTDEQYGKPMYKIWLDAICEPQVRLHLHYTTGLFYVFASISVISAAASVAFGGAIARLLLVAQYRAGFPDSFFSWAQILSAPAALALTIVFAHRSLSLLEDIIGEGKLALNIEGSRDELQQLAKAAIKAGQAADHQEVVNREVRTAIARHRPLEVGSVTSVTPHTKVEQYDLRTDETLSIAHVAVYTDSYENAARINGRANLYNGPTQWRIQSALNQSLAPLLHVDAMRLQIIGNPGISDCPLATRADKDVEKIGLEKAIELGVVTNDGAVARCCRSLEIDYVLLRNGGVIGPNPELEVVIREVLKRLSGGDRIFDPFSGTGLTERLAQQHDPPMTVEGRDALDWDNDGAPTGYDAFTVRPSKEFGLVVVDPLYEDVVKYLKDVAARLKFKHIVVVSGDVCDVVWNDEVKRVLERIGSEVAELSSDRPSSFGKRIFVYSG